VSDAFVVNFAGAWAPGSSAYRPTLGRAAVPFWSAISLLSPRLVFKEDDIRPGNLNCISHALAVLSDPNRAPELSLCKTERTSHQPHAGVFRPSSPITWPADFLDRHKIFGALLRLRNSGRSAHETLANV
jgi:hypothetical protein